MQTDQFNETPEKTIPEGPALYVIAVPIGNLEDLTLRALRILGQVDRIYCEDTRKTARLLSHFQLHTPLKSYRVHQIEADNRKVLEDLEAGLRLGFCSEAGTPALSDPGSHLVRAVRQELPEIPIYPLPGASALAGALSVAGFQSNPLIYLGFLSPKGGRRRRALEQYRDFEGCIVLYESVHRIESTLTDLGTIFMGRNIFIAREMTKIYEEYTIWRPEDPENVILPENLTRKGEFTLIIGPRKEKSQK